MSNIKEYINYQHEVYVLVKIWAQKLLPPASQIILLNTPYSFKLFCLQTITFHVFNIFHNSTKHPFKWHRLIVSFSKAILRRK